MGRLFGTFIFYDVDVQKARKTIEKVGELQLRSAARAFVKAAIVKVPVDTGMARGSFLNIGRFLKIAIPIPKRRTRHKDGSPILYYHRPGSKGIPKTPEAGANLSVYSFKKLGPGKMNFEFQSKVLHYVLEDRIGIHSQRWGSFEAGRNAFIKELRNLKKRLPRVEAFLLKTTISFGRGSGVTRVGPKPVDRTSERIT